MEPVVIGDATLYLGDCMDVLPLIGNGKVDALITDPPYFYLYGEDWDAQWRTLDEYSEWLSAVLEKSKQSLMKNGSVAVFSSQVLNDVVASKVRASFSHLSNLVWLKKDAAGAEKGLSAGTTRSPVSMSERITLAGVTANPLGDRIRHLLESQGRSQSDLVRHCTGRNTGLVGLWLSHPDRHGACSPTREMWQKVCCFFGVDFDYESHARYFSPKDLPYDILQVANVKRSEHPCEKPVALMEQLILGITRANSTLVDPFLGSGTTGVAAIQLGRKFIGIERDERYFEIACRRIEQAVSQGQLFAPESAPQPVQESLL